MPFTVISKVAQNVTDPLLRSISEAINRIIDRLGQTPEYFQTPAEGNAGFTPTNYRYPPGHVLRGAAAWDGVTDDSAAIQAVIDTGHDVIFPAGSGFLGAASSGAFLSAAVSGQRFTFEAGAKLIANGVDGVFNSAALLEIDSLSHIVVINPSFESNWEIDSDRDVPHGIVLRCTTASCRHITIINPKARLCQTIVQAVKSGFSDSFEVDTVDVINGYADNCYYGTGWAYTGNNVRASYKTLNAHRPYIGYGCHTQHIKIFDEHDGTVTSPSSYLHQTVISAASFTGSIAVKDTHEINLSITTKGQQYIGSLLSFNVDHVSTDTKKGVMYDIDVTYNDRGSGTSKSIAFNYFVDDVTTASFTGTGWDRITLRGYAENVFDLTNSGTLGGAVVQTVKGVLNIGDLAMGAKPSGVSNPFITLFNSGTRYNDSKEVDFTPVVEGTSTPGAGTYSIQQGRARKRGGTVAFDISLVWSAHTGTGNMIVTGLPFTSLNQSNYFAVVHVTASNLTFTDTLAARIGSNTDEIVLSTFASGGALTALALDTAATLNISGTYEAN